MNRGHFSEDRKRILAAMQRVSQKPCILCGGNAEGHEGAFIPNDNVTLGQPPGKTRIVIYSLCESCYNTEGSLERVEEIVFRYAEV